MWWKDIINFEELYEISEYGDIRSKKTQKILSPYISNKGYKCIDLNKNGKREKYIVHRLVAIHFVPNPNNYPIVLHMDNNKLNIHYSNLKWGTYSENNAQAIRDGLNKVPRPDNRKYYELYKENSPIRFICYGAQDIIDTIGYGSDTIIRNYLFRKTEINRGAYKGFKIQKIENIPLSIKFR